MSETPNGLLPSTFEHQFERMVHPVANLLARMGFTPDLVTIISLAFAIIAGVLIAFDHLFWALLAGIAMGLCDILDGQIAKLISKEGKFGGVLDSMIDRYSESMVFCGLGVRFYFLNEPLMILITALALIGSFEVSYVKARSEGAGFTCNVGILQRSERLVLLAVGILFGGVILEIAIIVVAILTHFTTVQRLLSLRRIQQ
jgi:CDP-diacylglycerol--glycerol-3-phosphate 3-phosphatidyltransferase